MAENLGPSPQSWIENLFRYIRNWPKMAPLLSPGADLWTYGFNPGDIPMEYGKLNKGACRNLGQYG